MSTPTNDFRFLWNDLPREERERLMPYMIESQILHMWQTRNKVVEGHKRTLAEIDAHINNLRNDLNHYRDADAIGKWRAKSRRDDDG